MDLKNIRFFKKDDSLHDKVVKKITIIREQGAPPKTDTFSFNKYLCDLCKGIKERSEIIQCPFCGRWICRENCWEKEHLGCLNCAGIIKMVKDSEEINLRSEKIKMKSKKIDADNKKELAEIKKEKLKIEQDIKRDSKKLKISEKIKKKEKKEKE